MKTNTDKIQTRIERVGKLCNETILRYTDEIDFDEELSLYDVMMKHFVNGELDDVFSTDVTEGMSDAERKGLFDLVRVFQGLCFALGDAEYWIDSSEGMPITDYAIIAEQILDSYDYLLGLAKVGGRGVLEQLSRLRVNEDFSDVALVQYLRNTFIDDRLLSAILLDMAEQDSLYDIFTSEQKGVLLTYPEGTLYSYDSDTLRITYPLLLGIQMYNDIEGDSVDSIEDEDVEPLKLQLREFFSSDEIEFADEAISLSAKYRDYLRRQAMVLNNDVMNIVYDYDGEMIQAAWTAGDEFLGGGFDTPYSPVSK